MLENYDNLTLVGSFGNAMEALAYLKSNSVDLIFMDIRMPELNGIELAKIIDADNTLIIFTTAYSQYAVESYDVNAIGYLVKPIDRTRLHRAIEKAVACHDMLTVASARSMPKRDAENYLIVKSERRYVRICIDDIIFVEGLKDYVILQMPDTRVITRFTLKSFLKLLPASSFLRVSKSYVINMDKVSTFDSNDIRVDQYTVPIGQAYRESVMASLLS